MFAGVSLVLLAFLPETYGPTILKAKAKRIRKESGDTNVFAPIELEKKGAKQMVTVVLLRPLHMIVSEAIVLFTCLYLSLAYAIFYLFFVAYPLIFQGIYHFNTGEAGLTFLPIFVGALGALGIFVYYDGFFSVPRRPTNHGLLLRSIDVCHSLVSVVLSMSFHSSGWGGVHTQTYTGWCP